MHTHTHLQMPKHTHLYSHIHSHSHLHTHTHTQAHTNISFYPRKHSSKLRLTSPHPIFRDGYEMKLLLECNMKLSWDPFSQLQFRYSAQMGSSLTLRQDIIKMLSSQILDAISASRRRSGKRARHVTKRPGFESCREIESKGEKALWTLFSLERGTLGNFRYYWLTVLHYHTLTKWHWQFSGHIWSICIRTV